MDGHGRETFHFTRVRVCWVFSVNSISFHSAAPLTNMKHLMMHHVMKYYLRITLKHSFSLMSVFSFRYLKVSTILLVGHDWWRHWFDCTLYMIVMTCDSKDWSLKTLCIIKTPTSKKFWQLRWWHNMIFSLVVPSVCLAAAGWQLRSAHCSCSVQYCTVLTVLYCTAL